MYVHTCLDLSATDIYNEIKRLSHMQQLTDIRLETFEILRRFDLSNSDLTLDVRVCLRSVNRLHAIDANLRHARAAP